MSSPLYRWRQMTAEQREAVLATRREQRVPWHGPPHFSADSGYYLMTSACYEHHPVIGKSPARMAEFEQALLEATCESALTLFAWVVLPNHYHFLVRAADLPRLLRRLEKLHGATSFRWNREDGVRGRKVWHRAAETEIKSEGHYWATMNYVLHNAVRHGYVNRWQDWPYSNAAVYLKEVGHELAKQRWISYPLFEYGNEWDPPEL